MADTQVAVRWTGEGLQFEAAHASHPFLADGNSVAAHSPVQQLLLALASCTAADIIDIAGKMRVEIAGLDVQVEGDRNAEPPRYFKRVHMRYTARGVAEADRLKIERAVELSHDKYCSVLHSLRNDIEHSSAIEFEGA